MSAKDAINAYRIQEEKTLTFLAFLAFLMFPPDPVEAKPVGKGGKPGELLTFGAGAKSFGMGKAFVSVANDASATVWNPGGLGLLDRSEITALHTVLFADTSLDYLGFAMPSLDGGALGLSVLYLSSSGFEGRDANNLVTDPFTNTQFAVGGSYGIRFSDRYGGGLSVKYFSNSLGTSTSGAITIALGSLLNPLDHLWIGLTVNNLISMDIGDPTADKIPVVLRGGVSYRAIQDQLTVGFDYDSSFGGWYVGGEYRLFQPGPDQPLQIFLRGGANFEELTMGFGAWYQEYGVDYAFSTQELGGSHRFSMTMRFGESMSFAREERKKAVELAKKTEAQRQYQDAREAYRLGQYEESAKLLARAVDNDPELAEAKYLKEKVDTVAQFFKKSPEDEAGQLLRKAVDYWVDGDNNLAVDGFRFALSKDPENPKYKELVRLVLEKLGVKTAVALAPDREVEPVATKLFKARGLWLEGKYTDMVPLCQEAIKLEPTSVEAHLLLGTAYYSIGIRDKAIDAWKRARQLGVQINPQTNKPFLTDAHLRQLDENIQRATNELRGGSR